jgi:hypothetical protein
MIEIAHTSMLVRDGNNWQASLKNHFPTVRGPHPLPVSAVGADSRFNVSGK